MYLTRFGIHPDGTYIKGIKSRVFTVSCMQISNNRPILLLTALCFFIFLPSFPYAQQTGLRFSGQDALLDRRTSLDLGAGTALCLGNDFEISFEMSFPPGQKDYFGYILRILDEKDQNVDLIHHTKRLSPRNFRVITGKQYSDIAFALNNQDLFTKWNSVSLRFLLAERKLILTYNGNQLSQEDLPFSAGCFRLVFGANNYKRFKTNDVPPMNIRNVRIKEAGELTHHWPLGELSANAAADIVGERTASVSNPVWIRERHSKWQHVRRFSVPGYASVAYNPGRDMLYVAGEDSLHTFSVRDGEFTGIANSRAHYLPPGNQAVYDPVSGKLINLYPDQKKVLFYNEDRGSWTSGFRRPTPLTEYWHANKFISAHDSSLYVLAGYGQLKYKNQIQKVHLPTGRWEVVNAAGDSLAPRYLAGAGIDSAGSAYIIGGYGSQTGQQMLSPENYYDLLRYDLRTRKLQKVYELEGITEDFAFANSLVIDRAADSFYGLVFPNNKYKSRLQLIRGSLKKPVHSFVGDQIPYDFHDIESFADLFYSSASKKLIAVTLFFQKNNTTDVRIYTISFPPETMIAETPATAEKNASLKIALAVIFSAGLALVLFLRIRRKRVDTGFPQASQASVEGSVKADAERTDTGAPGGTPATPGIRSSILLFGPFQVFDAEGNDLTRKFTPLLKELLLIILVYSIRWDRGVSSEKLYELLWSDKSEKDARNNRSVNMAKLKSVLEAVGDLEISKKTGYWKFDVNARSVFVDYLRYIGLIRRKGMADKAMIDELVSLIGRGRFLENTDYEWLDDLKSEVSEEVINILLNYAGSPGAFNDPEYLNRIMNYVFYFDTVNEEAMMIKCKALMLLGKHTLAHHTFEKFQKDYFALYGENYERSFPGIMES